MLKAISIKSVEKKNATIVIQLFSGYSYKWKMLVAVKHESEWAKFSPKTYLPAIQTKNINVVLHPSFKL